MRIVTRGFGNKSQNKYQSIITGGFTGRIATAVVVVADYFSQLTNLRRSIDKYVHTNIYTAKGISVYWEGVPFKDSAITEWVVPRIVDIDRDFYPYVSTTEYGHQNRVTLQFNIFVKKSGATISDRHYVLRDTIGEYFVIGQDISLKSYVSDSSTLASMRVRDLVSDGPMPETSELLGYEVTWRIDYMEEIDY